VSVDFILWSFFLMNSTRYIVLQNWLANPQGNANSFVEIDLVQEHLNFWIKVCP
jgi:hypothetical protein